MSLLAMNGVLIHHCASPSTGVTAGYTLIIIIRFESVVHLETDPQSCLHTSEYDIDTSIFFQKKTNVRHE